MAAPETSDNHRPASEDSFDALRAGFTASVSHELRTPLARILVLLDSADLPGADIQALLDQARAEVQNAGELIDEILFLSELESEIEVVSLGMTNALPVLEQVIDELATSGARAGLELKATGDASLDLPLRPRMLRIVAENLAENAIRYAGHGATFTLSIEHEPGAPCCSRPTTGSESARPTCRACSSASGAPTPLARPAAPGSASRS